MNVLILGANGLVGNSFDYGTKLTRKDIDLLDFKNTFDVINYYKPDAIINCAGHVGGVKANMDYKFDFFKKNMLINLNVIEAAMKSKTPNLISFLSTCIFPDDLAQKKLLVESDLHLGEPHDSNYPYAYSKRMIQVLSKIAREQGFNYQNLIPCNLYGLHDNYNLETSHLIPALIRKFYLASKDNSQVEIWGDGTPLREFMYSGDIPKIIDIVLKNNIIFDDMIISPSQSHSINDVSNILSDIFSIDRKIDFYYDVTKPNGQKQKQTDNSLFKSFCEKYNFELTPLKLGLEKTINYFIEKYENNPTDLKL